MPSANKKKLTIYFMGTRKEARWKLECFFFFISSKPKVAELQNSAQEVASVFKRWMLQSWQEAEEIHQAEFCEGQHFRA